MCITVFLVTPFGTEETVDRALSSHYYAHTPVDSAVMRGWGWTILPIGGGQGLCMCGTSLGAAVPPEPVDQLRQEAKVKGLKRQGWSDAKVERWLESKRSSHAREERVFHALAGRRDEEIDRWLDFLNQTLTVGVVRRSGSWSPRVTGRSRLRRR